MTHFFWSAPWALAAVAVIGGIFTSRRLAAARRAAEDGDRTSGLRRRPASSCAARRASLEPSFTGRPAIRPSMPICTNRRERITSERWSAVCSKGRRCRSIGAGRWTSTHLIALTANVFKTDHDACLEAGMDGFLSKPLDIGTLRDALLQCAPRQRDAA